MLYCPFFVLDKTAPPQILSTLFPQTASEKSLEEIRQEQQKKEEEAKQEKEKSWKHMKLGLALVS